MDTDSIKASKEQFYLNWKSLFPGSETPVINIDCEDALDREILILEEKVNKLRYKLRKEEFLLSSFYKFQDIFKSHIVTMSPPNELECYPMEAPEPEAKIASLGSLQKKHLMSVPSDETEVKFSVSVTSSKNSEELNTHKNSFGNNVNFSSLVDSHKYISSSDYKGKITNVLPKTPPSTFPRKKKSKVELPNRRASLESSTNAKMPINNCQSRAATEKISKLKIQDELPSPIIPIEVSKSEVQDELPPTIPVNSIQNEENINTDSQNNIKNHDTCTDIDRNRSSNEETPLPPIYIKRQIILSTTSSEEDNDHIYTDIDQLKINKPPLAIPEEDPLSDIELLENQEIMYENAHIKPKIEKLASFEKEGEDEPVKFNTNRKKRLGSNDRKGLLFSDDLDVTSSGGEEIIDSDINVFTSSQESLHSPETEASEVTQQHSDDEYYDDDEHIYANVEEFMRTKDSDNDSSSDHDTLSDSISLGLPSPSMYREMTSDEIAKLKNKIHSDDDMPNSQDEYDSDDLAVSKLKLNRANVQSSLAEPSKSKSSNENNSSAVKGNRRVFSRIEEDEDIDDEEVKANRMRKYLVMNLLDSEKCYFDCLDILFKFMKPLHVSSQSSQPILTELDFIAIFHETNKLHNVHKNFLLELEPRIENWNNSQLIGDLFIMIMNHFDVYYGYIGNYKNAMDTVLKCRNANQQFSDIMSQDIRIPSLKDPLKLEGLLYKPVDRLTQYSLILNDLLKYTSPDHPDHPLIVEVSGALFDLFEQVNVDSSKKKRRQRQLLKEATLVEIVDGERRTRSLILFNDVMISAKLKSSRDAFVCKWYASLSDINIKPYPNSEAAQTVSVSAKTECDKLRASIANTRAEIRKEHMPLQQVVSSEHNAPFVKRTNLLGHSRSSSRSIEKLKKKISEQEALLALIAPSVPFYLYHKSGKNYVLLLHAVSERQSWLEALKPRLKRIHARNPPSIQLSSLELQQAFETVLKVSRLGRTFGAASPFLGPTRPLSMDFSKFDQDKESLTGFLFINIHNGKGFARNSDTYVVLEMDSYGHFFKKAKTKPARGSDPVWDEVFEFEIEACSILRLNCYNKLRLMGDDMTGKVAINLLKENLLDNRNHCLGISLDRGQGCIKISICFSTSFDGIKKTRSISESGVFGVPISIVSRREKSDIPVIVLNCIKEIEKRGMDEVGIYRLSGIASEIQHLKKLFNDQTQNALLMLPETDVHAVAGLLKLYFRELPKSLFTSKLYHKFVEGLSITDAEEKEFFMCDILHQLPRCNLLTTLYLFEHLRRVALRESINKMGVNNLATVFGPTVLRPSSSSDKENERSSCNVGTFDIGALDVMSQVGIFRYFLSLTNNERTQLPPNDLQLWRRLNPARALELEEKLMETAEEFLI